MKADTEETKEKNETHFVLQSKFMAGIKSDVKESVLYFDDSEVIYPCGHNVVFYNIVERGQRYISGIEGT